MRDHTGIAAAEILLEPDIDAGHFQLPSLERDAARMIDISARAVVEKAIEMIAELR